jgi:hypothetical protein
MAIRLPLPENIAGLRAVADAWQKALRIAGSGPAFTVGICDDQGHLVAGGTLQNYNQVQKFSREMSRLGYTGLIAGAVSEAEMQGCDVIYTPDDDARDIFDDGGPSLLPPH